MAPRVSSEQLQTLTYLNHARKAATNLAPVSAQIGDLLDTTALAIIGDRSATNQFLDALDSDRSIADILDDILGIPRCYVALVDRPGQDTAAVCVFADVNEAYDWVTEYDDDGTAEVQSVEYVAAALPEFPPAIDPAMLASDIASLFVKGGYWKHGLDVAGSDILPALPAFIAAIRAHSDEKG